MKQFGLKSEVVLVIVFYAFNELGELYFRASRCTLRTKS